MRADILQKILFFTTKANMRVLYRFVIYLQRNVSNPICDFTKIVRLKIHVVDLVSQINSSKLQILLKL